MVDLAQLLVNNVLCDNLRIDLENSVKATGNRYENFKCENQDL